MKRPAVIGGDPVFPDRLPFARPLVPPLERVTARLAPGYEAGILTNGPLVRTLEEEVAARLGVAHVVAVSSCTSGLLLVLQALAPERSVVLPSFTFSASAHAIAWNGLEPVFVECDPATFQVDVGDAEAELERAGGILATHVNGAPCRAEEVEAAGREAGVPVVFDAAHAFGARRQGRPVGGFGDAEVFSMSPTKLVVAGEGGLVATNRADVAEAVRIGRDYGNPGDYDTRFPGLNARLSELHAAVALESLALLPEHLAIRRSIAELYREGLAGLPGITPQLVDPGDDSTYKFFTVQVDADRFGLERDVVVEALRLEGIDTRCYFSPPVHLQQAYARRRAVSLRATERLAARVLSLPLSGGLQPGQAAAVVEALAALHGHAGEVAGSVSAAA
jgi:dTDP-4-amino-4,6-dideoxygalactose transaminase